MLLFCVMAYCYYQCFVIVSINIIFIVRVAPIIPEDCRSCRSFASSHTTFTFDIENNLCLKMFGAFMYRNMKKYINDKNMVVKKKIFL